jgi:hypothetical protein
MIEAGIIDLLAQGLRLEAIDNITLRIHAPVGMLSQQDRANLAQHKLALLDILTGKADDQTTKRFFLELGERNGVIGDACELPNNWWHNPETIRRILHRQPLTHLEEGTP